MNDSAITFQISYPVSIEKLWNAITDPIQMKKWYFDFHGEFDLNAGTEFNWYGGSPDGKVWHHRGKILEILNERKLMYSWEYPGYAGYSIVTWELLALAENSTKLYFSHEFIIPFDPDEKALKKENFEAGWNSILNDGLRNFLKSD